MCRHKSLPTKAPAPMPRSPPPERCVGALQRVRGHEQSQTLLKEVLKTRPATLPRQQPELHQLSQPPSPRPHRRPCPQPVAPVSPFWTSARFGCCRTPWDSAARLQSSRAHRPAPDSAGGLHDKSSPAPASDGRRGPTSPARPQA